MNYYTKALTYIKYKQITSSNKLNNSITEQLNNLIT
jgi:hypothetical protein